MYSSRRLWLEHERLVHRKIWQCFEHVGQLFSSPTELSEHLKSQHSGDVTEGQIKSLLEVSEATIADARTSCPICLAEGPFPKGLGNHISFHLENFAIFSIPRGSLGGDSDSDREGREVAQESGSNDWAKSVSLNFESTSAKSVSGVSNHTLFFEPGKEDEEKETGESSLAPKAEHTQWHDPDLTETLVKCPFSVCEVYFTGPVTKVDMDAHMISHYDGDISCIFCREYRPTDPHSHYEFKSVNDLKRHLISVHDVKSTIVDLETDDISLQIATCRTCLSLFRSPQQFYRHIDNCMLHSIQQKLEHELQMPEAPGSSNSNSPIASQSRRKKRPNDEAEMEARRLWEHFDSEVIGESRMLLLLTYPAKRKDKDEDSSTSPPPSESDWIVTPQQKVRYDYLFDNIDKSGVGFIGGDMAVRFFPGSGLENEILAQVWTLADIRRRGMLDRDEFALAMFLVDYQRKNPEKILPAVRPRNYIPPSLRDLADETRARDEANDPYLPSPSPPLSSAGEFPGFLKPQRRGMDFQGKDPDRNRNEANNQYLPSAPPRLPPMGNFGARLKPQRRGLDFQGGDQVRNHERSPSEPRVAEQVSKETATS